MADGRDLERIVLTGFMGSGKTTVGRVLAGRLGWRFADLDEHVVTREGLSIPEIFDTHGEAFFRQAEVHALADLLRTPDCVIALGGGAPETPELRTLLGVAENTFVVHLHAPFDLLFERCVLQAQDPAATERPLARERTAASERYLRRQTAYAAVAHHRANAGLNSPDAVADAILSVLLEQQLSKR
jgi:shikimate kinase